KRSYLGQISNLVRGPRSEISIISVRSRPRVQHPNQHRLKHSLVPPFEHFIPLPASDEVLALIGLTEAWED
ncbi:hypothetical protein Tco_0243601, partial [Tanacetum coccineum]